MIIVKENLSIFGENIEEEILKQICTQYLTVKEFFEEKEELQIRIILCSNKEELKFFSGLDEIGESTTGRAIISENIIVMYTPQAIEENTPKKKENFRGILAHEITHLFYNKRGYPQKLQVINEGLASYIQWVVVNKKEFNEEPDLNNFNLLQEYSRNIYKEGLYLINYLIKKAEKSALFEFLEKIKYFKDQEILMEFNKLLDIKLKGGINQDD